LKKNWEKTKENVLPEKLAKNRMSFLFLFLIFIISLNDN
jgi:hypothetical protein